MIIGVPKEIKPSEYRVGITPSTASRLIEENHTVLIQKNSGEGIGATDDDYKNVERVLGHEYFHNWTGNRITLRDWFHLSIKEGLTV